MAIVKIVNEKYYSSTSIKNLINYATDYSKTHGLIGAIGTNPYDIDKMISQMRAVKNAYGKCEDCRQARHIVVSFEENESVDPEAAYTIAYDIARFYADRFQICFGVHVNTDNIHIHFIQNTVSYVDGKLFSGSFFELSQFKIFVKQVLTKHLKVDRRVLMQDFENDMIWSCEK